VYLPDFSYQGSDFCRAVIEFAESGDINKQSHTELIRHTVNLDQTGGNRPDMFEDADTKYFYGHGRIGYWELIGKEPLSKGSLQQIKKADKPYGFLRCCFEWRDYEPAYETDKTLRSHLPIAADHKNSAYQHIGLMLGTASGTALVDRCLRGDLYQDIAEKSNLPAKHSRKLIKLVMVPWGYGAGKKPILERVKEFRRDNAGAIPYLDNLDDDELEDFVKDTLVLLKKEFKEVEEYRKIIRDAIKAAQNREDREELEGIEWRTTSRFVVHQNPFKTRKEPLRGRVANGFSGEDVRPTAKAIQEPYQIDWKSMITKTPPNLVHSQDATTAHQLISQGSVAFNRKNEIEIKKFNRIVTVHDSFSVLVADGRQSLDALHLLTNYLYAVDPLYQFISHVTGEELIVRKRDLPDPYDVARQRSYN